MKWSLRSINHRFFVYASFVFGAVTLGYALKRWSLQETDAFSLENISQMYLGALSLVFSYLLFKNKHHYPLKKSIQHPENTPTEWKPMTFKLHTDIRGRAVPLIFLKAVQKNPRHYRDLEDYEVTIRYAKNGKIIPWYRSIGDRGKLHDQLRLKLHDLSEEFIPPPHPSRWNTAEDPSTK